MIYRLTLVAASLLGSMLIAGTTAAQTLRVGLADDPDILDPTLARTLSGRIVFAALCDKLFGDRAATRD
jgi:peptide/nickel transport system substrate-binding protein